MSEPRIKITNEQAKQQLIKDVTIPQLKKMCEWFTEDTGKDTDWMMMLITTVAATFDSIYEKRRLFDDVKETGKDDA